MLRNIRSRHAMTTTLITVVALVAEFLVLEGAAGVSLPSDRHSAVSTVAIMNKRTGLHYVTRNNRFTVVDVITSTGVERGVVLREFFERDEDWGVEGPPSATVTVETIDGPTSSWKFAEPGERGDVVTSDLYMVTRGGAGDTPNTYSYFSLVNGRKVRTSHYELARDELSALNGAVIKAP
ncbi:MAG TPA: hypothetical protein VFA04_25500 [Bryobacteraceae bacterium]|nr:hypothetical protein [Bryobacteraceae bacterium]